MPDYLIVADDLTGALDCAVAFAGEGRRVVVTRRPERLGALLAEGAEVVALSTGTREMEEGAARQVLNVVAATLAKGGGARLIKLGLMKKVDSRLKGHVGAEVAELARALPGCAIVVAPAIPDMRRVVRHGRLSGEGIAQDILVASLFDPEVRVPDTLSDADLDGVASAGGERTLWVGARGLAFALSRVAYGSSHRSAVDIPGPVLFAIGSRDPVTVAQVERLRGVLSVTDAPDGAVPPDAPLSGTGHCAVSIIPGDAPVAPAVAAARFADGVVAWLLRGRPGTLVLSGGETADAVLDRLGIETLQVVAEIRPGLPLCYCETEWGKLTLITKSGGFGAPALLCDLAEEATDPRRDALVDGGTT